MRVPSGSWRLWVSIGLLLLALAPASPARAQAGEGAPSAVAPEQPQPAATQPPAADELGQQHTALEPEPLPPALDLSELQQSVPEPEKAQPAAPEQPETRQSMPEPEALPPALDLSELQQSVPEPERARPSVPDQPEPPQATSEPAAARQPPAPDQPEQPQAASEPAAAGQPPAPEQPEPPQATSEPAAAGQPPAPAQIEPRQSAIPAAQRSRDAAPASRPAGAPAAAQAPAPEPALAIPEEPEPPPAMPWLVESLASVPLLDPDEERFELVLYGNIEGDLAQVSCRDGAIGDDALLYALQAGFFRQREEQASQSGNLSPIALNSGDSVFPGALGRYLLSKGESGADELASLLARIPYALHAVGNHDLEPPSAELLSFLRSARTSGLPLEVANLRCVEGPGEGSVCGLLDSSGASAPYKILSRGPLKVGIVGLLDPGASALVSKRQLSGLTIEEPEKVLETLVPRMREQGADLVIAVYHLAGKQPSLAAEQLAGRVQGIDLVVTSGLFERFDVEKELGFDVTRPAGYFVSPRTLTYVVGADSGSQHAVLAELVVARSPEGRWRISRFDARSVPTALALPEPQAALQLQKVANAYCEDWGKPILPGLELAQAFDLEDLETFVLNVMRFETGSEVAFSNARAFRNHRRFPLTDTLTRADLQTTLPYGNTLATFEVTGAALEAAARKLGGTLVGVGLEVRNGSVLVNGRPLNRTRPYRVAANQFIAEGGDEVFDTKKIKELHFYQPSWAEAPPTIEMVVARYIETGAYAGQGSPLLSPEKNFPDLYSRFLWTYTGSVYAAYNKVAVSNPTVDGEAAYDKPRLTVTPNDVVNLEAKAFVRADSRNHGWDNEGLLQYATTRIDGQDGAEDELEETKDLVRAKSAYKFLGLRAATGDRWWAPVPYTELQAETELSRPEERAWHLFELTGIVGALLRVAPPLELKLGINVRRDLNQPDGRTTFGLIAAYQLTRFDLVKVLGKPVQVESELEYFFNSIGHENISELRSVNSVNFAFSDKLFFTTNFSAYLYRTALVRVPAHSTEVTIGLNFLWDKTVQSF